MLSAPLHPTAQWRHVPPPPTNPLCFSFPSCTMGLSVQILSLCLELSLGIGVEKLVWLPEVGCWEQLGPAGV